MIVVGCPAGSPRRSSHTTVQALSNGRASVPCYTPAMAVGEFVTYERDFFRLDYPAAWSVRENRLLGVTDFHLPDERAGSYPPGIALMTLPETGMPLEQLLRSGIFFLMRDL